MNLKQHVNVLETEMTHISGQHKLTSFLMQDNAKILHQTTVYTKVALLIYSNPKLEFYPFTQNDNLEINKVTRNY